MSALETELSRNAHNAVFIANELEQWQLVEVFDHSIEAVRVQNYCSKRECRAISERATRSQLYSPCPDHPPVGRPGQEMLERGNALDVARSQENTLPMIREMRRRVHPYRAPVDQIRV